MRRIAFIPARGGSKRIPRKNIRLFSGRPIVEWPLTALTELGGFDKIFVSTDDLEISSCVSNFPVTLVSRPPQLADDQSTTIEVLKEFLASPEFFEFGGDTLVYMIYPTSQITPILLSEFLKFSESEPSLFSLTVGTYRSPVQRALTQNGQSRFSMLTPQFFETRTQDLSLAYFDAGKIYGGTARNWLSTKSPLLDSPRGFVLPMWAEHDLDTIEDWNVAEKLFELRGPIELQS